MARLGVIALEELENSGGYGDGEVDTSEINAEVADAAVEQSDITNEGDNIGSAINDAGAVEDIRDTMQESVDSGEGLDETAAEIAEVAIEGYARRLGYTSRGRLLPAKESFGGRNSRIQATKIAIEEADNIIVRAWNAIVATVKKIFASVVEFFKRMFGTAQKMDDAVEKLEVDPLAEQKGLKDSVKGLKAGTGKRISADQFQSTVGRNFSPTNTSALSVNDVVDFVDSQKEALNGLNSVYEIVDKSIREIKTVVKDLRDLKNKERVKDDVRDGFSAIMKILIDGLKTKIFKDNTILLYGGDNVTFNVSSAEAFAGDGMANDAKPTAFITKTPVPNKVDGPIVVKTWDKASATKLKTSLSELSKINLTTSKNVNKIETIRGKLLEVLDDVVDLIKTSKGKGDSDLDPVSSKEFKKTLEKVKKMIGNILDVFTTLATPLQTSAMKTISGGITLFNENRAAYTDEK